MIKLNVLEAKMNLDVGKLGTFTMGEKYWSRLSKDGSQVMAMTNEGNWATIHHKKYTKIFEVEYFFDNVNHVFARNYEFAKFITINIKPEVEPVSKVDWGVDYQ